MHSTYKFGGKQADTAILRNILDFYQVKAPHTGQAFTEEMLFGIGGGIGYGYFVFEFSHFTALVLGTRHSWQSSKDYLEGICSRIGAQTECMESGGRKTAKTNLLEALKNQQPAIVWVDQASIPYYFLPDKLKKSFIHVVGVLASQNSAVDQLWIDDHSRIPFRLDVDTLTEARTIMPYIKTRVMTVSPPKAEIQLKQAIIEGIRLCSESALNPPIKNFGIEALNKWAKLIANPKDKKGWPKLFSAESQLYSVSKDIFHYIETSGTGGSGSRHMYADFLLEAAAIIDQPILAEIGEKFRETATQWSSLANTTMPDSVKVFRDTKELLLRKWTLFEEKGPSAEAEILQINEALDRLKKEVGLQFPFSPTEIQQWLEQMKTEIEGIYKAEKPLLEKLLQVIS